MSMPRPSKAATHSTRTAPYTAPRPTMENRTPPPHYANPTSAHERASAAWSQEDDTLLWDARENRKLGWPQTAELFQGKSPNACRKRYERLKQQKAPDEWEGPKFDALAEVYVQYREEMWRRIAEQLGERDKWQTLEQQCMSKGVKELLKASNRGRHQHRASPSGSFDENVLSPHSGYGHGVHQLGPPLSLAPSHSGSRQSSIPSVHAFSTPTRHRTASTVSMLSWEHTQLAPIGIDSGRNMHEGNGPGPLPGIREGFEGGVFSVTTRC